MTERHLSVILRRSLIAALTLGVFMSCGGGGSDAGVTNPPPTTQKLGSITLSPSSVSLTAGKAASLTAVALDQQGGVIDVASGFTYTSSAPAIAEVSTSGSVLAVSAGSATITASLTRDGVTRTATSSVTITGVLADRATILATPENAFTPDTVVLSRGGQVTFNFQATHNVNFLATGAPANILTTTGTTVDRIFAVSGDFPFTCSLHGGMTGMVRVR